MSVLIKGAKFINVNLVDDHRHLIVSKYGMSTRVFLRDKGHTPEIIDHIYNLCRGNLVDLIVDAEEYPVPLASDPKHKGTKFFLVSIKEH